MKSLRRYHCIPYNDNCGMRNSTSRFFSRELCSQYTRCSICSSYNSRAFHNWSHSRVDMPGTKGKNYLFSRCHFTLPSSSSPARTVSQNSQKRGFKHPESRVRSPDPHYHLFRTEFLPFTQTPDLYGGRREEIKDFRHSTHYS